MHIQGRGRLPQVAALLDSVVPVSSVVLLIASYLLLVFLVPVVVSAFVSYRALPRTTGCPQCAQETVLLHSHWLRRLRRAGVERRWCLNCGWAGLARPQGERAAPAIRAETSPREATALDVRSLRLDGRTWRVQLQCWRDAQLCYGRLVFVEPTGRSWADVVQAFSGSTQFEVLGQALSIPDRALASRLRQLLIAGS